MTKKTKIAVLISSCVVAIIGLKAWDFSTFYPEAAWWQAMLAGIAYVAIFLVVSLPLIGLATWWIER